MQSRAERRWLLAFALIVMLASLAPYLLGFAAQGDNWRFTGFVFGVEDGNSYIAKMLSGASGAWLFRTPYTAMPQKGMLAFFPYLLLGKLTASPAQHEQLVVLYHLYRFAAGMLAIYASYDFLALFLKDVWIRRVALLLTVLGGGLGWLLVIFGGGSWMGSLPLEFYSPESFGFLALFALPHLALARALLLWGLVIYLRPPPTHIFSVQLGSREAPLAAGASIGLLWWGLALAQPLTVVVGWFVIGVHLLSYGLYLLWGQRRKTGGDPGEWKRYLLTGITAAAVSSPFVVYTALAFRADAFLSLWQRQNLIRSPHPVHYLLAYGLLLPFAVVGARRLLHRQPGSAWLPTAWVIALPLLAYAPYELQRRLPEGIWVALVTLAMAGVSKNMIGLQANAGRQSRFARSAYLLPLLLLLFLIPSTLFLYAGGLATAVHPQLPAFQPAGKAAAFEYLAGAGEPGQVALAGYTTGNALPAWAPVRVVAGHGPETVGLANILPQLRSFFDPTATSNQRLALIHQYDVSYVFWGPDERSLGSWLPEQAPFLEEIYSSDGYTIFRVAGGVQKSSSPGEISGNPSFLR